MLLQKKKVSKLLVALKSTYITRIDEVDDEFIENYYGTLLDFDKNKFVALELVTLLLFGLLKRKRTILYGINRITYDEEVKQLVYLAENNKRVML